MSGYTSYDGYNYSQNNYSYNNNNNSYSNYDYGTNNSAGGSSYSNSYNYSGGYSNNSYGDSSSSGYGSYSGSNSNYDYNYGAGSNSSNSSGYSSNNNSNSSSNNGFSNYRARSKSPPDPNRIWNFDTNPFTIIGITSEADATLSKIKKLYHLKILSCHPDKSKVQTRSATVAATEVTTAYNYLKGKDEGTLKRLYRQFQAKSYSSSSSSSNSSQYQQPSQSQYQYSNNNYNSSYNSNNYNNYQYQQNWDYSKQNYSSGYSNYSYNDNDYSFNTSNGYSSSSSQSSQSSNSGFGSGKYHSRARAGSKKPKTKSKMLRCNYCEKYFLHPYTLLEHEKIHATGIECSVCKKAFTTVGGAKRHITIACGLNDENAKVLKNGVPVEEKKEKEKKEPLFLCTTCGKGFNEFLKKVEHEKVHFSGIQCSSCRKQFVSVRGARLHIKNICSKISYAPVQVLKNGAPITAEDEQEGKCTKKKPQKPEKVPLFLCATCGKGFNEFLKKVEHEKLHFAGIQCSACKKEFIHISGARRHIAVTCGKENDGSVHVLKNGVPLTKEELKKESRPKEAKTNLWDWKPKLKSDTWKFSSNSMGKSSEKSKTTKTKGKKNTETDTTEPSESKQQRRPSEKPFECHKCGKKFVTERCRSKHLLTHSGNGPFECSYCAKTFATRSAANSHIVSSCGMWNAHILKDGSPL